MEMAFQDFTKMDVKEFTYLCEALDIQLRQHFCPAWNLEHWPCTGYSDLSKLTPGTFYAMGILSVLDVDGAEGYHNAFAGLAYSRIRRGTFNQTVITGSHEACELRLDPLCNRWVKLDDNSERSVAIEACDPCEADSYEIEVDLFGEKRKLPVSDFVLPSYFDPAGKRPYSYMDTIDNNVHELGLSRNGGGYLLLQDPQKNVTDYWGRRMMGLLKQPRPTNWFKGVDPLSRATRRLKSFSKIIDHATLLKK